MSTAFSDSFIRNIKTTGRYTDAATQGLNLQVKANGGKYWALRYLFQDKRYDLSLGSYPNVSLREARVRATAARAQLNAGQRPEPTWKQHPPKKEQQHSQADEDFQHPVSTCVMTSCGSSFCKAWLGTANMCAHPCGPACAPSLCAQAAAFSTDSSEKRIRPKSSTQLPSGNRSANMWAITS